MNQTGLAGGSIVLPSPKVGASGVVDRYVSVRFRQGYEKLTVAEARQLRKELGEAIKEAQA